LGAAKVGDHRRHRLTLAEPLDAYKNLHGLGVGVHLTHFLEPQVFGHRRGPGWRRVVSEHIVGEFVGDQRRQATRIQLGLVEIEVTLTVLSTDAQVGRRLDGQTNRRQLVGSGRGVGKPLDIDDRVALGRRQGHTATGDDGQSHDERDPPHAGAPHRRQMAIGEMPGETDPTSVAQ
jgi:hypothetical protein